MKDLLLNVGSGGGGPATAVAGGGVTGGGPVDEPEKEEAKEEEKEESDDDMASSFSSTRSDFRLTGYLFRASVFSINLLYMSMRNRLLSPREIDRFFSFFFLATPEFLIGIFTHISGKPTGK